MFQPYISRAEHLLSTKMKQFQGKLEVIKPFSNPNSQNHSTVGARRDLWRSSPTPLAKAGSPTAARWDHSQPGLEYLKGRKLHNLSGQLVPVLCHPQNEDIFPYSLKWFDSPVRVSGQWPVCPVKIYSVSTVR